MYACGGSECLWAGSILAMSSYQQLRICTVFTAIMAEGLTYIVQLITISFPLVITITTTFEAEVWALYFALIMRPVR